MEIGFPARREHGEWNDEENEDRERTGAASSRTGQCQSKYRPGLSDDGTEDWRLDSQRGEKTTRERSELGLHAEREREGEERNDRKTWEEVIGGGGLWLLMPAGNESRCKIEDGFLSRISTTSWKPTTASIAMFISKVFVGILFVAAVYAAAIGQFFRLLPFRDNTG